MPLFMPSTTRIRPLTRTLSAIALAVMIRQYPFEAGWVTAKVFGLIAFDRGLDDCDAEGERAIDRLQVFGL